MSDTTTTYYLRYRVSGTTLWTDFGEPETDFTEVLQGLQPNTTYDIEVVASNDLGQTTSTITTFRTAGKLPGAPSGLSVTSVTTTSLVLNWNQSPSGSPPIQYQVMYRVTGQPSFVPYGTQLSTTSLLVTGLNLATTYDFLVAASNSLGTTNSQQLTISTLASGTSPSAPINLVFTNITQSAFTVGWSASTGTAPISYQVQYRVHGGTTFSSAGSTNTTSLTVSNLLQATQYDVEVIASNQFGSATSAIGLGTTVAAPIAPSQPGAPTASNIAAGSLTLSWAASATGTAPISYQVQFRLSGQTPAANFANFGAPVSATTEAITGLASGTAYDFQIVASNAGGTSTGTSTTVTTSSSVAPPAAPTGLFAQSVTSTSLTLGWQGSATGTQPISYQPQFRVTGQPTWVNIGTSVTVTTIPVTNLTASTSYDFRVIASNAAGSATSATLTTSTPAAGVPPSAPTVTIGTVTSTTLPLTWTASTGTGTTTYTPQYRVTGSGAQFTQLTSTTSLSSIITGLSSGFQYDVQVVAANAFGSTTSATVTGTTTLVESTSGTVLTSSTGTIIDASLVQWRLNGQPRTSATVQRNTGSGWVGTSSTTTAVQVVYWNHIVYYQDATTGWFSWSGSAWVAAAGDPRSLSESAQGTLVSGTTGQIVDAALHVWTLVSSGGALQVAQGGTVDNRTHNVINLLYWNHSVWYEDSSNLWYNYNSSVNTWSAGQVNDPRTNQPTESSNGTTLTTTTGQIIDASGITWKLVTSASSGLQIAKAGIVDLNTTRVTTVLYWNHVVYFQNSSGQWLKYDGTQAYPWELTVDPRTATATPTFFDDFTTLSLINSRDATTSGNNWYPVFTWAADGMAVNDSWMLNPFNPATPITDVYTITQSSGSVNPTFLDTFSTFSVYNNYYIQPGVGAFIANGITYSIDSSGNMLGNGAPLAGGGGTGAAAYYQGTVYAKDAGSTNWFTWNGSSFAGPVTPPPSSFLTTGGTWRYISFEQSQQGGSDLTGAGEAGVWCLNPLNPATPISGVYVEDTANQQLKLGLVPTPTQYKAAAGNDPYCGSLLSSDITPAGNAEFGYFEVTVAVDRLIGFGAEVTIESHHGVWPPEIDLVHIITDSNGIQRQTFIVWEGTFPNQTRQEWTQSSASGFDPSQMHSYGVRWTPQFLTFYVDRVQVWQIAASADYQSSAPLYFYILTFQHYTQLGDPAVDAPVIANPAALPVYAHFDQVGIWPDLPFGTTQTQGGSSDLVLACEATPSAFLAACGNKPTVAGQITTQTSLNQQYGYFESEMVIPNITGTNGAFILYSNNNAAIQIDVQEWASGANSDGTQWQVGSTTIWSTDANSIALNHIYSYEVGFPFDISSGKHKYGVLVDPSHVTVYWDRIQVAQWPTPAGYNFPLYMLLGVGSGGSWSGSIPGTLPTCTPGSGSFTDPFGNNWSLNGSGNPVVNGGTDTGSHANELFLYNTTVWQLDIIGSYYNAAITSGGQSAGSIPWTGPFTLGPAINDLPLHVNFSYVGAWNGLPFVAPSAATISDILLSSAQIAGTAPSGSTVGSVTVVMSDGNTFGGTLVLSGPDVGSFKLLAGLLLTVGTLTAGTTDQITITAAVGTQSLQKNFFITITGTGPPPSTGPNASSPFLTVALQSPFNSPGGGGQQVVSQRMYGVFVGYGGDRGDNPNTGPRGPNVNAFSIYSSSAWTSQMALVNPGLHMITGNLWPNGWFDSNNNVVASALANLIGNFYKVDPLGISSIIWDMDFDYPFGGGAPNIGDITAYGTALQNLAKYIESPAGIMPNGKRLPLIGFGSHNEPDSYGPGTTANFFNAYMPKVRAVKSSYVIVGPQTSILDRGFINSFLSSCTTKPDGVSWDEFNLPGGGDGTNVGSAQYLNSNYTQMFADGLSGALPAGYTPKMTIGGGNLGYNGTTPDKWTINGAMYWAVNYFNGLGVSPWQPWMAAWDDGGQNQNGIVTDSSGFPVSPAGYVYGIGVRNVFGPRWNVTTNAAGLMVIACTPPGAHIGIMIINAGKGAQNNKTVAFSNWPVNATGNAAVNVWQMTNAVQNPGQDGARTTINVVNGVTTTSAAWPNGLSFPDPSITVFWI